MSDKKDDNTLTVTAAAGERLLKLIEDPPAPSEKLRSLMSLPGTGRTTSDRPNLNGNSARKNAETAERLRKLADEIDNWDWQVEDVLEESGGGELLVHVALRRLT